MEQILALGACAEHKNIERVAIQTKLDNHKV